MNPLIRLFLCFLCSIFIVNVGFAAERVVVAEVIVELY